MPFTSSSSRLWGAILLIAGCCTGAGMLGLPLATASIGFLPAVVVLCACCAFMIATGLLLAETALSCEGEINLLTMVEKTLGKGMKAATAFLFLSLFYCVLVAYCAGIGELISSALSSFLGIQVAPQVVTCIMTLVVGVVTYLGTHAVDYSNRFFMGILILSYFLLVGIGLRSIHPEGLTGADWRLMFYAVPVVIFSFGYHNLVPSITNYLHKDPRAVRKAIVWGNLIPLLIYLVWEAVLLGLLSRSEEKHLNGSLENLTRLFYGHSATIAFLLNLFAFSAVITSFFGVALSCVDFLKDGLKMREVPSHKLLLSCVVLLPPLFFSFVYPNLFLQALGVAGGVFTMILYGMIPGFMAFKGRSHFLLPGGKPIIVLLMLISLVILVRELVAMW